MLETKESIIKNPNRYICTDNIAFDLNGRGMAKYLESLGFIIVGFEDLGTFGLVETAEGIFVSTNGWMTDHNPAPHLKRKVVYLDSDPANADWTKGHGGDNE